MTWLHAVAYGIGNNAVTEATMQDAAPTLGRPAFSGTDLPCRVRGVGAGAGYPTA